MDSSDTQILRFLSALVSRTHDLERGDIIEVPSPAIRGRTDIVVVLFPRADIVENGDETVCTASGYIVRNRGRYDRERSMELAESMSEVLRQTAGYTPGHISAYDDSARMIGETDDRGHWLDLPEYPSAPRQLARIEKKKQPRGGKPRKLNR